MRRADVFPPILIYMTASGESSGQLEPMLARAAEYLEREFNTFTAVALSLLEPAIIIVMGGLVAPDRPVDPAAHPPDQHPGRGMTRHVPPQTRPAALKPASPSSS